MSFLPLDGVVFGDSANLDAFGNLSVAIPGSLFDSQQEYGLDTVRTWDAAANGVLASGSSNGSVSSGGNSVGPVNTNSRMTPITVSGTNTHYAVLQSKQYIRYIPGHGQRTFVTGIFAAGTGYTATLNLRTSTSGTAVTTAIAQADWNVDKFDGSGPSGFTIDFSMVQILVIDAQMLYAGRIRIGFDIDGCLCWAHYFKVANRQAVATMQTYNLPVRIEGRTSSTATVFRWGQFDAANGIFLETSRSVLGGTAYFECCSVQTFSQGEQRGFPMAIGTSPTTRVPVGGRVAVLSIRPKATYNGFTNRAHIELAEFVLTAQTNDAYFEVVVGGTVAGAVWTSVGPNSVTEYDVTGTTVSGGTTIISGRVSSGRGATTGKAAGDIDVRNPLVLSKIDALAATQTAVSLVVTAESGTSNITADLNWHEQTI